LWLLCQVPIYSALSWPQIGGGAKPMMLTHLTFMSQLSPHCFLYGPQIPVLLGPRLLLALFWTCNMLFPSWSGNLCGGPPACQQSFRATSLLTVCPPTFHQSC
jgi:hypothetical protein